MDDISGIGFKIIWWHWHEGFRRNQICHEVIIAETMIGVWGLYTLSHFLMLKIFNRFLWKIERMDIGRKLAFYTSVYVIMRIHFINEENVT